MRRGEGDRVIASVWGMWGRGAEPRTVDARRVRVGGRARCAQRGSSVCRTVASVVRAAMPLGPGAPGDRLGRGARATLEIRTPGRGRDDVRARDLERQRHSRGWEREGGCNEKGEGEALRTVDPCERHRRTKSVAWEGRQREKDIVLVLGVSTDRAQEVACTSACKPPGPRFGQRPVMVGLCRRWLAVVRPFFTDVGRR